MEYAEFLVLVGLTQAQMDAAALAMPEPIRRANDEPYLVAPSAIHGRGCFATRNITGRIGMLRIGDNWTEAGRYINHADEPNALAFMRGGNLMARGQVTAGQEITLDYAQVRATVMGDTNV